MFAWVFTLVGMRLFFLVLALLVGFESSPASAAVDDSLAVNMSPQFYRKRSEPVLKIALVYYGDYYRSEDLDRIQALLEKRFEVATNSLLKIQTVAKAVFPFKNQIRNFPDYKQPYVTDIERLQRLWYYDHVGAGVLDEVYEIAKLSDELRDSMKEVDALLFVTGAQFDALGYAIGRVGVTENPMEIAWGLPDGGRVEYVTDARVVDELIHEIGHTLFIGHSSTQCQSPDLTYQQQRKCCEESPARDDVMSYCRSRSRVDETFQNRFSDCNLSNLKKRIIPAMLSGGAW
jgi:hypothetical protein